MPMLALAKQAAEPVPWVLMRFQVSVVSNIYDYERYG